MASLFCQAWFRNALPGKGETRASTREGALKAGNRPAGARAARSGGAALPQPPLRGDKRAPAKQQQARSAAPR